MPAFATRTVTAALLTVTFVSSARQVNAQAALLGPGAAYVSGGMLRIATAELDERLATRGYPQFGQTAYTLGIGGYRVFSNRVMLGFEGQGLVVGQEDHANGEVGLSGGYATLGAGYAIELSRRAWIYPRIGIGAGGFALEIESVNDSVGFDDVLANPTRTPWMRDPLLSRDGMVVDLGGGAEFLPGGRSGFLIGLRVGYLLAPWDSDWDSYERDVSGGPDASLSGPYMRVTIGGAWRR